MKKKVEKFPFWGQLLYSSGYVGISIVDRIWVVFLIYFFLPPAESGMPLLLSDQTFLRIFTVLGLITIFGRLVDAIADPLVATWSDRSKSKLGRRRVFLLYGGLPLMACAVLLFFPPSNEPGIANTIYVAGMLGLLLFFFTFYVVPWLALIPELSHTDRERMNIVTMQAVFSLLGVVIVMIGGFMLWGAFENGGMEKTTALRTAIIVLAVIGLISCYVTIIPINEKRYCDSVPSEVGIIDSLKMTFKNTPFISYLFGTICLWFALNMISSAATYYVTVLLQKKEEFGSVVFGAVFGVALLLFPVINFVSRYIEKKVIMIIGLAVFAIASFLIYYLGTDVLPFSPTVQAFILFGLIGIPAAALFVVPNAMISDLAEYDSIKTGTKREGMYFGAQGLVQKINLGISSAILVYLLSAYGKDVANPLGVRLSGPVAAVVCVIGIIMFIIYPEKKIYKVVEDNRKEDG